jgi:hypothetical protein
MLPVANFSITGPAEIKLRERIALVRIGAKEVFGMVYIEYYNEADGTPVKGFVPGYQGSNWTRSYITSDWVQVRLSNGIGVLFSSEVPVGPPRA